MHPTAFRKAMIEAFLAGANMIIETGSHEQPTREEAKDWFDNQYGLTVTDEKCDCCEEKDEE